MKNNETLQEKNKALAALVVKAKAGDQAAFTELYDRTAPELYRCIRAMTRDEDLAWDVQQDSYLRAYRSLDKLENSEAFFPWLRRIAVNVTATQMSQRRSLSFTELACDDEDALPELPDTNADNQPELSLDRKETSRLVQEILSKLPEEQQLIVGMRYYDELSVKEIADTLQLSTGAVKAQLFHGRKKVETAVRALEKQGIKLYGLSPIGFLVALMRRMEPAQAAKATAVKAAVAKAAVNGVAASAAAKPVTALTFSQMIKTSVGKILIGALSVAVIGGGIWAGGKLLNRNQPSVPKQPTETVNAVLPSNDNSIPSSTVPNTEARFHSGVCGSKGDNLTWTLDTETGLLTIDGSGAMADYNLDNKVPWYDFAIDETIVKVSLPEGLTSIGGYAFAFCSAMTELTIPDSVTSIGGYAFAHCSALTSVTIPDGVASIGEDAFYLCSSLKSVTIPDSVASIGEGAFTCCSSMESATLGTGVTSIGDFTFQYCSALTSVTIPDGVTSIAEGAFRDCAWLRSVTIGSGVTSIAENAFTHCSLLTSIEVNPGNPNYCSMNGILFRKDQKTLVRYPAGISDRDYTIPDSVTGIGACAFESCASLRSVTIPDGVTSIGVNAFSASGLTDVVIPGSVTSIRRNAFDGCSFLTSVTILDGVTGIGSSAFNGCSFLTSVTIPDSVTNVGDDAFLGCKLLTSVTIPDGVTRIGSRAFGWDQNAATLDYEQVESFTIYGHGNTAAQTYAAENGFAFVVND